MLQKAVAYYRAGDYRNAARMAREASHQQPRDPKVWELLAAASLRSGEKTQAISALQTVCELSPSAMAWQQLGQCLIDVGRQEDALDPLLAWLDAEPAPPLQAVKSLAGMLLTYERYEHAERLWRIVLDADPASADAPAALSYMREIANDLAAAQRYAEQALALEPSNALARLTTSQLALRQGDPAAAISELKSLLDAPGLASVNRSLALYRLAKAHDQLGQYDAAWGAAVRAGQTLAVQVRPSHSTYSLTAIAELYDYFATVDYRSWHSSTNADRQDDPVFLVGFPRSGTTLTERMLSTHSEISCVEEQDTLGPILQHFVAGPEALTALSQLDDAQVEAWRRMYFEQVDKHADRSKLVVDKMPMDSLYLGLIYRFFPNAKIIFALRDPRDVVLSCFMQSFALNEAMRHFLSIDDTTRYYAASMRLATLYLDTTPLPIRLHSYEDLVQDTENQAQALFKFLELPWQPEVLNFHQHSDQKVINTPSYSQVSQPVYTGSMARWKRYEQHLAPYMHRLAPFIQRFGYESN